jgi:hypothetical protein
LYSSRAICSPVRSASVPFRADQSFEIDLTAPVRPEARGGTRRPSKSGSLLIRSADSSEVSQMFPFNTVAEEFDHAASTQKINMWLVNDIEVLRRTS